MGWDACVCVGGGGMGRQTRTNCINIRDAGNDDLDLVRLQNYDLRVWLAFGGAYLEARVQ